MGSRAGLASSRPHGNSGRHRVSGVTIPTKYFINGKQVDLKSKPPASLREMGTGELMIKSDDGREPLTIEFDSLQDLVHQLEDLMRNAKRVLVWRKELRSPA